MRIAFLSTFYPFRGGIAQFNASLYRALEKVNSIKAFTFTQQYPEFIFPGETQIVTAKDRADKIPAERVLNTLNPLTYYSTANRIMDYSPDITIMKYWTPFMAPALGTVAKQIKRETKVITILDNVIPHEKHFFDETFTKYFLNQNHGFVVMSDSVKNDLLKFIPDAKYILHPHPLYNHFGEKVNGDDAKKKLNIPTDKKVILFFGFIRDYKGLDLLIEAMPKLNDDYILVVAGEVYSSFKKYAQQIEKTGMTDRIYQYLDYISDDEVPLFFSAADVCVLPYKSGTQSGVTSIAYHFDLPVIVTDVGGLKEIVEDEKTGLVIKEPNPKLIAEAINKYFDNEMKEKMIPYIQKYKIINSWDKLASDIINFAKKL